MRVCVSSKIFFNLWLVAFLLGFVLLPASALAAPQPSTKPVVQAVLFWSNGCTYCDDVLLNVLPPLQERYGEKLIVLLVELVTLDDIDRLYRLGALFGLAKEQVNVPLLLVDHTVLVGAEQIPAEFPTLVEKHLAAGGVELPALPGLDEMLPSGVAFTSFDPRSLTQPSFTAEQPQSNGIWLAWIILVGMLAALVVAGVGLAQAIQGKPVLPAKKWQDRAIPLLALIGLAVAIYLTYVEGNSAQAVCGPIGDCNAVQSSPYAKLFGYLPVGLLGALGFLGILGTWAWRRWRSDAWVEYTGPALFGMTAFGTLLSIYLTYLEIFVIRAVCIWCLSSAVIITLLMLLSLPPVRQWLAAADEEE